MTGKMGLWILVLLIVSVNVSAITLSTSVPEKYTDVTAGERLYFEIEVKYPENDGRKDLIFEYEISNEQDEVIAFSKVLKAIETQASFVESIVIPETAKGGLHILDIQVSDYEDLNEQVSTSFFVEEKGVSELQIYLYAIFGVVVILTILVIISLIKLNSIRRKGNDITV